MNPAKRLILMWSNMSPFWQNAVLGILLAYLALLTLLGCETPKQVWHKQRFEYLCGPSRETMTMSERQKDIVNLTKKSKANYQGMCCE